MRHIYDFPKSAGYNVEIQKQRDGETAQKKPIDMFRSEIREINTAFPSICCINLLNVMTSSILENQLEAQTVRAADMWGIQDQSEKRQRDHFYKG